MVEAHFSAKRWQLEMAGGWRTWTAGTSTSRFQRASLLAEAVRNLTMRWASCPETASRVVGELPATLHRCNELLFNSEAQTLAYTIWHLTDRYARVLHVLDELFSLGHLPIRKKRLSALEIGAGPSPSLHAIMDYYLDLSEWVRQIESGPTLVPTTHLLSLDRGDAWSHLVHGLAEELIVLDTATPRSFGINYPEFESFSVLGEHRLAIEKIARWIVSDADQYDEHVDLRTARQQALNDHEYQPGAMDFIVLCNFVTELEMTDDFERELAELATSLTPGGVLLVLGSASSAYDPIFSNLSATFARSGTVRRVLDRNYDAPHPDPRLRDTVSAQLIDCLGHCRSMAPDAYSGIAERLSPDVRDPGAVLIAFPKYRALAFKREGSEWRKSRQVSR